MAWAIKFSSIGSEPLASTLWSAWPFIVLSIFSRYRVVALTQRLVAVLVLLCLLVHLTHLWRPMSIYRCVSLSSVCSACHSSSSALSPESDAYWIAPFALHSVNAILFEMKLSSRRRDKDKTNKKRRKRVSSIEILSGFPFRLWSSCVTKFNKMGISAVPSTGGRSVVCLVCLHTQYITRRLAQLHSFYCFTIECQSLCPSGHGYRFNGTLVRGGTVDNYPKGEGGGRAPIKEQANKFSFFLVIETTAWISFLYLFITI